MRRNCRVALAQRVDNSKERMFTIARSRRDFTPEYKNEAMNHGFEWWRLRDQAGGGFEPPGDLHRLTIISRLPSTPQPRLHGHWPCRCGLCSGQCANRANAGGFRVWSNGVLGSTPRPGGEVAMPWFKVDDGFHYRVIKRPRGKLFAAIGLSQIAGTWCVDNRRSLALTPASGHLTRENVHYGKITSGFHS